MRSLTTRFAAYDVPESEQIAGQQTDLPDRGQLLLPPIRIVTWSGSQISGTVFFGRHFFGSNQSAHGGAISLSFDELFGRLANSGNRPRMRTAYLHVNYRAVTPLERELSISVEVSALQGRKLFAWGKLHDGDQILADSEGLLVALRPGQP
jgi:acyl-coenzyme A thioesterase PaaI-like protein